MVMTESITSMERDVGIVVARAAVVGEPNASAEPWSLRRWSRYRLSERAPRTPSPGELAWGHPRGVRRAGPTALIVDPDEASSRGGGDVSEAVRPGRASRVPLDTQNARPTEMTGWVGWVGFAAVMMVMLGTFHVMDGLVALFQDDYFLVTPSRLAVHADFTTWGWVHLIGGILIGAAGIGCFTGKAWARSVGVVGALVSAVVNVSFLAAYPIWSTIMSAVDVLIIWALTVHGDELRYR